MTEPYKYSGESFTEPVMKDGVVIPPHSSDYHSAPPSVSVEVDAEPEPIPEPVLLVRVVDPRPHTTQRQKGVAFTQRINSSETIPLLGLDRSRSHATIYVMGGSVILGWSYTAVQGGYAAQIPGNGEPLTITVPDPLYVRAFDTTPAVVSVITENHRSDNG
jgi:hypothetical protein